jgi:hypothetical protein
MGEIAQLIAMPGLHHHRAEAVWQCAGRPADLISPSGRFAVILTGLRTNQRWRREG